MTPQQPVLRWTARAHSIAEVEEELARIWAGQDLTAKKGLNTFSVRRWMRPGSYRVSIVAMDAAGNVSKTVRLKLTVRR